MRDNPSRRAAFVLFPRDSCRTFAIVVRSMPRRSVVSWRSGLGGGLEVSDGSCRSARLRRESTRAPGHCEARERFPATHLCWRRAFRASRVRPAGWPAERSADLLQKRLAQRNDIGATVAQRRNLDVEDAEAIKQVLAEVAPLDGFTQIAVGRGDHPDVRLHKAGPTQALELALLQNPQELRLRGQAHLA